MVKFVLAAIIAGVFSIAPAFADEMMKCDEANMMKMQKEIDADTNAGMKKQVDMANAEMKMAAEAMHANKTEECAMHLNQAAKEFMASADEMMKCDEANMMKMQKEIDADTNPGMKKQVDMANKEMKKAMVAMKANQMDHCATHLNKAAKEFMMK